MYFSPFANLNQTEVWPRFQRLLKLLLWTKGIDIESKYPMPWVRCAFGNVCISCITEHSHVSSIWLFASLWFSRFSSNFLQSWASFLQPILGIDIPVSRRKKNSWKKTIAKTKTKHDQTQNVGKKCNLVCHPFQEIGYIRFFYFGMLKKGLFVSSIW